jgi:hypothetical protein
VDEVREHAYAVYPEVFSKELNIVVDIAINANTHVLEESLVNVEHSLMYFFWKDGIHALIEPLGEEDLVSDEGGREIGEQGLYVFQPVVDVSPLCISCETLKSFA